MCTNKGGLKQNESKQTNGIRVMGVEGLVHCDKHNDAVYVCVSRGLSVVRCVVCVVLGVFVCLPICLCFCNYMCVYLPALSTRLFYTLSHQMKPVCPLHVCVSTSPSACSAALGSASLLSFSLCLCLCIEDTFTSLLNSKVVSGLERCSRNVMVLL